MSIFHEGYHFGSGFQVNKTTSKPAVHREQEAAQNMLCHMQSQGLGEKKASVAFLSKGELGLRSVPQGELAFPECVSQKLVLCHFRYCP